MYCSTDGFATGGKDSCVSLWNEDFTPVTRIDLSRTSKGYKGETHCCIVYCKCSIKCIDGLSTCNSLISFVIC